MIGDDEEVERPAEPRLQPLLDVTVSPRAKR